MSGPERPYFVHPSSVVDEPCSIGAGTKIWHFCHISAGCRIGETPIVFEERRAGASKVNLHESVRSLSILIWLGVRNFFGFHLLEAAGRDCRRADADAGGDHRFLRIVHHVFQLRFRDLCLHGAGPVVHDGGQHPGQ